jgi:prephenate dehydratase
VENSTAGTVNAVYDLMVKHDFRIVRSVRIKVDHNLLVKPGTKREEIREIYSHGQALSQCAAFLQGFPNAKIIPCENTAVAAKMVDGKNQTLDQFEGRLHLKRAVISLEASRNPALREITARNSYGNNKNEISSSTPNPRA